MKQVTLHIATNTQLIQGIYEMKLEGDVGDTLRPGQFVNIALDNLYLRRPFSISDYDTTSMTLLYKVVGKGTRQMSSMHKGQKISILNGLGNGFNTNIHHSHVLLAGGGIGIAPLYKLAKELKTAGKKVSVALCFNTAKEIFYVERFKELSTNTYIATVDGSEGCKGFITNLIQQYKLTFDYYYACGPMPMLKSMCQNIEAPGEVSLEARMGCGFGICMGCSIPTTSGNKRVCKEGPVFGKEELIW